jgi:hypothetical protein
VNRFDQLEMSGHGGLVYLEEFLESTTIYLNPIVTEVINQDSNRHLS